MDYNRLMVQMLERQRGPALTEAQVRVALTLAAADTAARRREEEHEQGLKDNALFDYCNSHNLDFEIVVDMQDMYE